MIYRTFYDCRFLPIDMPEDRRIQIARDAAVRSIAEPILCAERLPLVAHVLKFPQKPIGSFSAQ